MKKATLILTTLSLVTVLFFGGCADMLKGPDLPEPAGGEGLLVISLAGANVGVGPALTMLPLDPLFTRYELDFGGFPANIPFYNSAVQLTLANGPYTITVLGFAGDKVVAKSAPIPVTISTGNITPATFTLKPYMNTESGVLDFSLGWDGLSRMPYRAELLVEDYADADGVPIPTPTQRSILLLDRDSAFVNLTGSLTLPPGEYRLTMSVTMDPNTTPASRLDIAHIYSNLSTPAPFYYGGGDLYISNTSPDSGAGFITGFTFTETPNATTVIGSEPGLDGTRTIMIMVPNNTILTALTPVVTTAEGAVITSPQKESHAATGYLAMDFTGPMIWTAQAKNGVVQKYTVVVSKAPDNSDDRMITNFFFEEHLNIPGNIDQGTNDNNAIITVMLPHGSPRGSLKPIVTIIGKIVEDITSIPTVPNGISFDFTGVRKYRVTSESGQTKTYTVTVTEAGNSAAAITRFAIEGYPDRAVTSTVTPIGFIAGTLVDGYYPISLRLPYGVSLKNLTPVIQYEGETLNPLSGVRQNFSGPVYYTVTPNSGSAKPYKVTITNDEPDKNTGIFDFRVTNVPGAKVVIGQKPRQDGKIPIVIQVPYGTDELNMIAAITLSSPTSSISPVPGKINFGSPNYQEAIYTVTSQGNAASQDYVVVVSEGGQYYYVDGKNGRDDWPDYYNGETEGRAFKTLAHAVDKAAASSSINKIFILGDLTAADGGDSKDSNSAFTINETSGKKITITSTAGSTLRGVSGKRVLTVKGGADLTFENINITGGSTTENGGGIYITGNSTVKFSGGNITGNTARSGGGVYVEGTTGGIPPHDQSAFNFMSGEISGNTATGAAAGATSNGDGMDGGGGVYVKGNATFWLAPGGTISNNTTKGAGGGVLVNGALESGSYYNGTQGTEYGFIMSGGRIVSNKSTSATYPHGGGGVYVAHGYFDMPGGEITGNTATRQGGGVFVHWGEARFNAFGNSTITGNEGVGSSKAICNRGITEMTDNARADKVYIWDYGENPPQSFTLAQGAQVSGLVLAYSELDRNFVKLAGTKQWNGPVCTIDLESRLIGGLLHAPISDWYGHTVIDGNSAALKKLIADSSALSTVESIAAKTRLPLNTFTGSPSLSALENSHKIVVTDTETTGKIQKR